MSCRDNMIDAAIGYKQVEQKSNKIDVPELIAQMKEKNISIDDCVWLTNFYREADIEDTNIRRFNTTSTLYKDITFLLYSDISLEHSAHILGRLLMYGMHRIVIDALLNNLPIEKDDKLSIYRALSKMYRVNIVVHYPSNTHRAYACIGDCAYIHIMDG